jgi:hypothetical protein
VVDKAQRDERIHDQAGDRSPGLRRWLVHAPPGGAAGWAAPLLRQGCSWHPPQGRAVDSLWVWTVNTSMRE